MIAGHFGLVAGVKAGERQTPLWALMLATSWLDVLFAPLFAAGLETLDTAPGTSGGYGSAIIHADYTHCHRPNPSRGRPPMSPASAGGVDRGRSGPGRSRFLSVLASRGEDDSSSRRPEDLPGQSPGRLGVCSRHLRPGPGRLHRLAVPRYRASRARPYALMMDGSYLRERS